LIRSDCLILRTVPMRTPLTAAAFYNRIRRHSHIGGVSPEAFETAAA